MKTTPLAFLAFWLFGVIGQLAARKLIPEPALLPHRLMLGFCIGVLSGITADSVYKASQEMCRMVLP